MRLITISIIFCCIHLSTFSQNLVSNGSFEKLDPSKTGYQENSFIIGYKFLKDWDMISPFATGGFLNGNYWTDTTHIAIARTFKDRENIELSVYPHSSSAYIRSNFPSNKTLFQTQLIQPLEKGKTYCIEFYYRVNRNLSTNKSLKREMEIFNKGAFGVFFTKTDYSDLKKYRWPIIKNKLRFTPQISVKLQDSSAYKGWVKHFATFTADWDYQFLIIGNHLPMNPKGTPSSLDEWTAFTNPISEGESILDFFIDDVRVVPYEEYLKFENLPKNVNIELSNIYFEVNSAVLKSSSFYNLDILISYLKKNSATRLLISGHTDNSGTAATNNKLSLDRAISVKKYLVAKGIGQNRIKTQGFGSSHPVASNKTKEGKAKNRRIEIKLI